MKCPHCHEEITKTTLLCPYCYNYDEIECVCEGGAAYRCHTCHKSFQAYNGYYYSSKPKKQLGKIDFAKVPFEWRGLY